MLKKALLGLTIAAGTFVAAAPEADAGVFYRRVAPVRRVAARAVLPPYPVARRAVVAPRVVAPRVVAPVYSSPVYVAPAYRAPVVYGPGIYVGVGF